MIEFSEFSSFPKIPYSLFRSVFKILGLAFILLFSLLVIYAYSQEGGKRGSAQGRKTILDFKDELKLNDRQVKEIEKLLQVYFKKEQEMLGKIREKETKLTKMLNSGGDIKEVKKLAREIYCLRGELRAEELETAKKIDGVLSEEQRKRWKEIRLGRR